MEGSTTMAEHQEQEQEQETQPQPPPRHRRKRTAPEAAAAPGTSIVEVCGRYRSKCGYCEVQQRSSMSFGMMARRLICTDYQKLIDRGWRRSGTFLYKPIMAETCCPQYTIRLPSWKFRPSKQQNKVYRRLDKYLAFSYSEEEVPTMEKEEDVSPRPLIGTSPTASLSGSPMRVVEQENAFDEVTSLKMLVHQGVRAACEAGKLPMGLAEEEVLDAAVELKCRRPPGGRGKRAMDISLHERGAKNEMGCPVALRLAAQKMSPLSAPEIAKVIVEHISAANVAVSAAQNGFINLRVTGPLVRESPPAIKSLIPSPIGSESCAHDGAQPMELEQPVEEDQCARGRRRQRGVDGDMAVDVVGPASQQEHQRVSLSGIAGLPPLTGAGPHKLTVDTAPARFTPEVFELYRKYQIAVHGDKAEDCTESQFTRFLVDSPLVRDCSSTEPVPESCSHLVPYGSYHQLYRIDGKLVAVGVVDILPSCLSSVYCFYDPSYRALSLGKLTALKEIEWLTRASVQRPQLRYYYLGYYIHTCPKMKYKGDYSPSELLCPETFTWAPMELCRPVLDRHPYSRLAPLAPSAPCEVEEDQECDVVSVDPPPPPASAAQDDETQALCEAVFRAPLLVGLPFPVNLDVLTPESREILLGLLMEYAGLVGPELASSLVLNLRD